MNISKADVARLGRRAEQPKAGLGEFIAIFVAGKLVNTKNARLHWAAEMKYKRGWRERVAQVLLETGWRSPSIGLYRAAMPKTVTFLANVHGLMDGDGLQVSLAPVRDALTECGVISGDADRDGHEFVYAQRIDRKKRGVTIRVSLRAPATEPKAKHGCAPLAPDKREERRTL